MSNDGHESLTLVTGPIAEPISVIEAQEHCRVEADVDQAYIEALITSARRKVENDTGRQLVQATYDLTLDCWPHGDRIEIPRPPLSSVTSVTYYDTANVSAVFAAASYFVDTASYPARLVLAYGQSWPAVTLRPVNGVVVRFVCGHEDVTDVSPLDKRAMLLLVGHWYENREAVLSGSISKVIELAYEALVWADPVGKV